MKKKPIEISYKKLGRNKAHGLAWDKEREVVIDSGLTGQDLLETLIHEIMHCQNPKWPEIKIVGHSKEMADLLWQQGFRKVQLK